MTDETRDRVRHFGGQIQEDPGELLGDDRMEREGELNQTGGEEEQKASRARELEEETLEREEQARPEEERLEEQEGLDEEI